MKNHTFSNKGNTDYFCNLEINLVNMMNRLTPAEEQVMLRLWKLEKASVKEVVELYKDNVPAYNTTSTIIRILERKKFIKHKQKGRGYIYIPRISRDEYRQYLTEYLLKNYFDKDKESLIEEIKSK